MSNDRRCGTCSAFERGKFIQGQSTGTCRAKPPQGVPHVAVNPVSRAPEVSLLGGWPPVSDTDWCRPGPEGWQPKDEQRH
jgi:hypothetical protein